MTVDKDESEIDRTGGEATMSGEFRPDISHDHLASFARRVRSSIPAELWEVLAPWSTTPRAWTEKRYGLNMSADVGMLCEVYAPIPWHEVLSTSRVAVLRHPEPSIAQLERMWSEITSAGLEPAAVANIGPWMKNWKRATDQPELGSWAVDIVAFVGLGEMKAERAEECAKLIGGRVAQTFEVPTPAVVWETT